MPSDWARLINRKCPATLKKFDRADKVPKYFVFFHVGPAIGFPAILVSSIKRTCADAKVIQCSDKHTPRIPGVDEYKSMEVDRNLLMIARLKAFAELNLNTTAAYVDTDMIFMGDVDPESLLQDAQVCVCRRYFDNAGEFRTDCVSGMDLSEYKGRTIGEVYPFIACFTVTRDANFWKACVEELEMLDPKFHFWFGDQEAIRNVINRGKFEYCMLPESVYACLPDKSVPDAKKVKVLHFKGPLRKKPMIDFAIRHGLIKLPPRI